MQNTTHYNLKKPEYTDFADIQDINDNMDTIDGKLAAPDGDGRDQTVSFTDADLDSGITSFPTFLTKIVSGMKLAKFIRDFKAGMAYVLHVGDLINNATCTESGKALDARMGKTLQDQITSLNDSLTKSSWSSPTNGFRYRFNGYYLDYHYALSGSVTIPAYSRIQLGTISVNLDYAVNYVAVVCRVSSNDTAVLAIEFVSQGAVNLYNPGNSSITITECFADGVIPISKYQ